MDKYALRRALLRKLIDEHFDGVVARFAAASGIAPSYVSRLLYPEERPGSKRLGEDLVDRLEDTLGIPGYFSSALESDLQGVYLPAPHGDYIRFELLDGTAGMGPGTVNGDYPEIVRIVEVATVEVRRTLGFVPKPGRIKLLTGRGESMSPMIENGDVLMIDTLVADFSGDGVYLINLAGVTQVKLLQARPDGIHVISTNPAYVPYIVHYEEVDTLHIGGKVVSAISIRAL